MLMTAVDTTILDATEAFCRWFQRATGRTNVWIAVQLTNVSIVLYFLYAGVYFFTSDAWTRAGIAVFCAGVLYLLTQTVFRTSIESSENSAYRRVSRGYRNPRRVRDALLRVLFVGLSLMMVAPVVLVSVALHQHVLLLSYSLIVLTTVLLYVLACDPLPPCPGALHAWWAARARPAPVHQGGATESSLVPAPRSVTRRVRRVAA